MLRECQNCRADFYKESYSSYCPDCNREFAAEKRIADAQQREKESRCGYDWGYAFLDDLGRSGCSFSFKLKENGSLAFAVNNLAYFLNGQANDQFRKGMRARLDILGWGQVSASERYKHIKSNAYSAGKSPKCHQAFSITWDEAGLEWRMDRWPRVKFINKDYKKQFIYSKDNVLDFDGILVYRDPVFGIGELQQEFDRGLRDYVLANPGRAKQQVFENTKNTKVEIGVLKRSLLATYMILATIGIPGKFANGFGWFGLPVYFIATYFIWKNKEQAWNTIWRGPARFTLGLHVILIFSLIKLNSFYAYLGRLLENLF